MGSAKRLVRLIEDLGLPWSQVCSVPLAIVWLIAVVNQDYAPWLSRAQYGAFGVSMMLIWIGGYLGAGTGRDQAIPEESLRVIGFGILTLATLHAVGGLFA